MKNSNNTKTNKIGNANLDPMIDALNNSFSSYQVAVMALQINRDELKENVAMVIKTYSARVMLKFYAKALYIIRKNPIRTSTGKVRKLRFLGVDKVLSITERGVIFRVRYAGEGWHGINRVAVELSHEQIAMDSDTYINYVSNYRKFIQQTYKPTTPVATTIEDSDETQKRSQAIADQMQQASDEMLRHYQC